jgi:hypothetical protein
MTARYGDVFMGRVLIDSATVIVADPVNAAEVAAEFERRLKTWTGGPDDAPSAQIGPGVATATGSDGAYPVWADIENGELTALHVYFTREARQDAPD